jgi:hypothetical protein
MILKYEKHVQLHSMQAKYRISFMHCYTLLKDNFDIVEIVIW